ncbi:hypothetical protein [Streptomyces sp. DH10]|uniref:hypothetical protein n=1 Tax=Streptomyces sp. DH10 TaxID=3040121 RepID=UPI00244360E1|nr:hypothetical protein [Streptomyces sp. DH10]MDG9710478.1 hypothetical protein [Streptomyces sp. DH10]
MNAPHALALDVGTRYARLAVARPGTGPPRPVQLPGEVPGEGLPLSAEARGRPVAALREAYGAYLARYGPPTGAVVVLPRRTARELAGPATAALAADGCPRVRVIGAAHALLALVRHATGAAAGTGEYLVCDAGARAVDAARCSRTGPSVLLRATAEATGPSGLMGTAFDRALLDAAGLPDDEEGHCRLAAARLDDPGGRRLGLTVAKAMLRPDPFDDTVVYRLGDRDVTAGAVRTVLPSLIDAVRRALAEIAAPPGATERPPLLLAGGLARLEPLTRRLEESHRLVPLPAEVDAGYAAVTGGALVAAALADPGDRYPYAVRISTHTRRAGRLHTEELELAAPGALEPGGDTVFAARGGRPAEVLPDAVARRPLRIEAVGPEGRPVPLPDVALPTGTPHGLCEVGVRVGADGVAALVLRPVAEGPDTETRLPLGPLPVPPET